MSLEDHLIGIACVVLFTATVIVIGISCIWIDHSYITINIKEKYTSHDQLYVVSENDVTYCVRSNIDYAKFIEGNTYVVAVAHNPYIGRGWVNKDGTWNIDGIIDKKVV